MALLRPGGPQPLGVSSRARGCARAPCSAIRRSHRRPFVASAAAAVETRAPSAEAPQPPAPSAPAPSLPPAADATPASAPAASFVWTRNWVPVTPLTYLDPRKPTHVTLLGRPLAVWRHASDGWRVMDDVCPHRLAPLSEGRLEGGGTRLACAYHGWEFDGAGKCTRVPQLAADARAAATACASSRSCVAAYPTAVKDGILFTWLDRSEEGLRAQESTPLPRLLDADVAPLVPWGMAEVPNDYSFWVEQGMDPAHAPFLHHGIEKFRQKDAAPLRAERVRHVDLHAGFAWRHRGYETKAVDMHALREFQPPYVIRFTYDKGTGPILQYGTMTVPVRPGVTRSFFTIGMRSRAAPGAPTQPTSQLAPQSQPQQPQPEPGSGEQPGGAAVKQKPQGGIGARLIELFTSLPHWLFLDSLLADQDIVMMARQEALMRSEGLTRRTYNLNSRSDEGISAMNRWLEAAGYPASLWGTQQQPQQQQAQQQQQQQQPGPREPASLEALLSRHTRHVQHCAVCQAGLRLVTRVCVALTAAAAVTACGAVVLGMLAVMGHGGGASAAAAAATAASQAAAAGAVAAATADVGRQAAVAVMAAVVLAWAAARGWEWREDRFVSGVKRWRKLGGYNMIGVPRT